MAKSPIPLRELHRLFGLFLIDLFTDTPFEVEVERDLSEQQQFLDVVILRRRPGRLGITLPDGFDDLADHNLITFKSHHEALDAWAMKELIGHYVAYRKLVGVTTTEMEPEDHFRLVAVCARYPHNLSQEVPWRQRRAGVYDCRWGTDTVVVIVTGELPEEVCNAPLLLFSASPERLAFGQDVYRPRSELTSLLLRQLTRSDLEGINMSYTMADFLKDFYAYNFQRLSPEEQRAFLMHLPRERRQELLEGLSVEERLAGLQPEDYLAALRPEDRLAGLSAEEIQQYLDRLTSGSPARPRKPRRKK